MVTGGDVIWNSPGHSSGMPGSMRTSPFVPNRVQRLPVAASRAIRRASFVPMKMRSAHSPVASASRQWVTPRQTNWFAGSRWRLTAGSKRQTLGAGARIEGDDLVEGGAEDEGVVHEDRVALGGRLVHVVGARGYVAGVVLPTLWFAAALLTATTVISILGGSMIWLVGGVCGWGTSVSGLGGREKAAILSRLGEAGRGAVALLASLTPEQRDHSVSSSMISPSGSQQAQPSHLLHPCR